ncbi:MAG TPA: hypothetical protein VH833_03155 [Gemmatimonadales bacterium]|jgi:hypothetical protein
MRRAAQWLRARVRGAGVVVCVGVIACAPAFAYRMPASLRSYSMLVPDSDSLSDQLAQAFGRRGLSVRRQIRGGGGPTAALVHFTFRAPEAGAPTWLHVRLADTRTGAIVGAAALLLDSLPVAREARADTILDSLGLGRRTPRQP